MATAKATDAQSRFGRRGRGLFLAALAALGVVAGVAGEVRAQDVYARDDGYGYERAAYFQSGKRGRDDGRGGGGYRDGRSAPSAPRGGDGGGGGGGGYRRGQVLPPDQRGRYVDDPGRYHLRTAPNGYGWVGDGRNAYLTQRSTGMVLDAVPGAYDGPRGGDRGAGGRGYEGRSGGREQDGGGGGGRTREQENGGGGKRSRR